jgi:hypothetical protein
VGDVDYEWIPREEGGKLMRVQLGEGRSVDLILMSEYEPGKRTVWGLWLHSPAKFPGWHTDGSHWPNPTDDGCPVLSPCWWVNTSSIVGTDWDNGPMWWLDKLVEELDDDDLAAEVYDAGQWLVNRDATEDEEDASTPDPTPLEVTPDIVISEPVRFPDDWHVSEYLTLQGRAGSYFGPVRPTVTEWFWTNDPEIDWWERGAPLYIGSPVVQRPPLWFTTTDNRTEDSP